MNIQEIRAQYPQYSDLSDEQLGKALHTKFYADMPYEQFAQKAGLGAAPKESGDRGMWDSLGRQLALTLRSAIGGVGGIANAVADPVVSGINAVSGANLPIPSQALDRTMTRAGLPEPASGTEKFAQAVSRGMVAPAGIAKAIPQMGAHIGTQIAAAGSGAGSANLAEQGGFGPLGQTVAGVAGGVVAPMTGVAAVRGAKGLVQGGKALIDPFTKEGQRTIAARAYQGAASDKQTALGSLEDVPEYVPDSKPTTAQATGDRGLARLEKTLRNRYPHQFADVAEAQDAARQEYLKAAFGSQADVAAAQAARGKATAGLRQTALENANVAGQLGPRYAAKIDQKQASKASALQDMGQMRTEAAQAQNRADDFVPVPGMPRVPSRLSANQERVPEFAAGADDAATIAAQRQKEMRFLEMQRDSLGKHGYEPLKSESIVGAIEKTLNRPGDRASDVVRKTLSNLKDKISSLTDENGVIDSRDLYTIRKEIGNVVETYAKETSNWDKRMTSGLQKEIQARMDHAITRAGAGDIWSKYLKEYSDRSAKIEAMKTGQEIYTGSLNPVTQQLSPAMFARQMQNRADDVAGMAEGSDVLNRVNADLRRAASPMASLRAPGSDTSQNLIAQNILQSTIGKGSSNSTVSRMISKGLGWIYTAPEEQIQQLVLEGALDPEMARQLLAMRMKPVADPFAGASGQVGAASYGGLLGVNTR
jgi:hypothetical protein